MCHISGGQCIITEGQISIAWSLGGWAQPASLLNDRPPFLLPPDALWKLPTCSPPIVLGLLSAAHSPSSQHFTCVWLNVQVDGWLFFFFRKPCQLTFSGKLAEETLGLESHQEEYDLVGLDLDKCQNDRISRKMTNSSSHCPPEIHISARTKRTPLYITACVSDQVRIETYVCTETN